MKVPNFSDRTVAWVAALLVVLAFGIPVGLFAWLSIMLPRWLPAPWGSITTWALLIVGATCYVRWTLSNVQKRKDRS